MCFFRFLTYFFELPILNKYIYIYIEYSRNIHSFKNSKNTFILINIRSFKSHMSTSEDFIKITEDEGILKKILSPATSDQFPKHGEKVEGKIFLPFPL